MTYLVLMQQKFSPGAGSCHPPRVVFYGDMLYLSIDLTHFIYRGVVYPIKINKAEVGRGLLESNARSGIKGPVNADFKVYIYDIGVPEKIYLKIVQTKDVNTYLHNRYELAYVEFAGMRFEMVLPGI